MSRGLPEVPLDPTNATLLRRFLVDIREQIKQVRGAQSVPTGALNVTATGMAFAVLVQWTGGINAAGHYVYWSNTPNFSDAFGVDVGDSHQWTDFVGKDGITRHYWVVPYNKSGAKGQAAGPAKATTLTSGTAVTPPTPPPPTQAQTYNTSVDQLVPRTPRFTKT